MGYYVRVLSPSSAGVALADIHDGLSSGSIASAGGSSETDWTQLRILRDDGTWLADVSRDVVEPGSMAADELAEFDEFLKDMEPASGATWARAYLKGVKTIYAFQINTAENEGTGAQIVLDVNGVIRKHAGGIGQADREGFSNEDGFHITWNFADSVSGDWWMAVRDGESWITSRMQLENPAHREAFRAGRVPDGITPSRD